MLAEAEKAIPRRTDYIWKGALLNRALGERWPAVLEYAEARHYVDWWRRRPGCHD